jgi:hypothetical protein
MARVIHVGDLNGGRMSAAEISAMRRAGMLRGVPEAQLNEAVAKLLDRLDDPRVPERAAGSPSTSAFLSMVDCPVWRRIDRGDPFGRLLELDELEERREAAGLTCRNRGLRFDALPKFSGVRVRAVPPQAPEHSGFVLVEQHDTMQRPAVTAVCASRRMRGGIHHADFRFCAGGAHCEVGVVTTGFDGEDTASWTKFGWCWDKDGYVRANARRAYTAREETDPWETTDLLGLRLDIESGTLTSYINGQWCGVLVDGLATDAEYCWCATMFGAGCRVHIKSATPRSQLAEERVAAARSAAEARIACSDVYWE